MRRALLILAAALLAIVPVGSQTQARLATTRALLFKHTLFFHTRTVALVDTPRLGDQVWRLPADQGKTLAVVFRTAPSTDGPVEIRGTFVDVGRFAPDDSRITAYSLQPVLNAVIGPNGAWPMRDTVFAIVNATATPVDAPQITSIRAIAMFPEKFDGKPVKLRGRFRGRNLLGDLPSWPRQTQNDFVLQAADGAVWVTGQKPKGKGFELDPTARRDVGRWLEVSGTMSTVEGLPMLKAATVTASSPDEEEPIGEEKPAAPLLPPPAINFSVPTDGETDIAPNTVVRIQFSRDMKAESFVGHVRVTCLSGDTAVPAPEFTINYRATSLALEIKFATPLPRRSKVTVDLLAGITAPDGTPLPPGSIVFSTGAALELAN